jgi:hypothetical protein
MTAVGDQHQIDRVLKHNEEVGYFGSFESLFIGVSKIVGFEVVRYAKCFGCEHIQGKSSYCEVSHSIQVS